MTHVNYDVVVQELLKGVVPLDSEAVKILKLSRPASISEFRTIGMRTGRQKGKTKFINDLAKLNPAQSLIIFPNAENKFEFSNTYYADKDGVELTKPVLHSGAFYWGEPRSESERFRFIFIDDAGFYFDKYSYHKTFNSIANVAADDVVVYLIG